MNSKGAILLSAIVAVMFSSSLSGAYAHTDQVIGDYRIEVGWDREPPVAGMDNAVTIMVTLATDQQKMDASEMDHSSMNMGDKKNEDTNHDEMEHDGMDHENTSYDNNNDSITFVESHDDMAHDSMEHDDVDQESVEHEHGKGVTGLASAMEVTITLNDKKTTLTMVEDENVPGRYLGEYTPASPGFPVVNFFAEINGNAYEVTFHPEKIEEGALIKSMSSDGMINVDVIATKPAQDQSMLLTVEFTDSNGDPIQHMNYAVVATQGEEEVLSESDEHAHHGVGSYTTTILGSSDPVDVQVTILGIGLPDEKASWTGPKDDTIPVHVTPEFGSVVMIVLGISILSLVAVMRKTSAFSSISSPSI